MSDGRYRFRKNGKHRFLKINKAKFYEFLEEQKKKQEQNRHIIDSQVSNAPIPSFI